MYIPCTLNVHYMSVNVQIMNGWWGKRKGTYVIWQNPKILYSVRCNFNRSWQNSDRNFIEHCMGSMGFAKSNTFGGEAQDTVLG